MKFHSKTERWDLEGSPKFLYTHVIFQGTNEYFSAQLPDRFRRAEDVAVPDSCLQKIPQEHIWPLLEDNLTICPDPEDPDIYIKQPRLSGYDGSAFLSLNLLQEARICEILRKSPHANVASYFGCAVNNGRITGLCFKKYAETLADRLRDGRSVDDKTCFQQIQAGVDHLHTLNLVHNDIHPDNIMFTDSDAAVLIDFDSCALQGCPLPAKRGQMPEGACTAEFENDDFGLKMILEEVGKAAS
ncbi:uncharacterized protein BDV14DRAFT_180630 [Aspergillus stella-maris]|uniref:uncharacterized protein n=1 Tax=Aspergillus stella-maris TaxID=1810926 RepID=UPI003CCD7E97